MKPKRERRAAAMVAVTPFLRSIRRRSVISDVLAAAGAAAVINEVCRWGTIGVLVAMRRVIPTLDIGPLVFAVLAAAASRRWKPAAAARRADTRLGLSDRLTSFLDFAGRDDVPAEVRVAQARETERALDGVRPAGVAPIRVWLAAGPLLLAASLIYPYFVFTENATTTTLMIRHFVTGDDHDGRQGPLTSLPDEGQRQASAGGNAVTPQLEAEGTPERSEGAVSPAKPEPGPATAAKPVDGPEGEGPLSAPRDETVDKRAPDHGDTIEPDQLASERVGRALAKVVDPLYSPGEEKMPAPEVAGSVSINLVPRSRTGDDPGEGSAARHVTVDLDALPEEYRPLVKTYFELLAAGTPGAGGANTTPPRSE